MAARVKLKFLLILALSLSACGGPTRQALEGALIQDGDLPAGYVAGQISDGSTMPGHMEGFDQRVMRVVQGRDSSLEYVAVALYSDKAAQSRDFDGSLHGLTVDGRPSTEIGERSRVRGNIIMFIRCGALAQMRFGLPPETLAYARRLDSRLQALAC